ncbi:hypothetical protein KIL84_017806, partial [Mauremys mutica]
MTLKSQLEEAFLFFCKRKLQQLILLLLLPKDILLRTGQNKPQSHSEKQLRLEELTGEFLLLTGL